MNPRNPSRLPAFAALTAALLTLSGCMTAPEHRAAVQDTAGERLTVGTVQKDIHPGMSGAEVIAVLGSPNIVTTDELRREVWTYDKVSSEVVQSSSAASLSPLFMGASGSVAGAVSGGVSQSAGAASRSDRSLTIVIKFDENKRVRDFAYRNAQF
jgi:outer membrane protein assembly factor BamE (lipoprotein component of BamABCDE complex)